MNSEYAELLKQLDHYANSIQQGVHITGTQMRRLLLELRAALAAQQGGEVHELRLCESSRLFLRPDRLYRFTVDPDCSMCREAASYYAQPGGSDNDR